MDTETRLQALRRVGFVRDLPEAAIQALAAIAVPLQRPAGSMIQLEGDPAEAMYIVVSGRARISRTAANGREQVLHVAQPGQHFNAVPVFDGGTCPANVEAFGDLELLALPADALRHTLEAHPALALSLLRDFTSHLRSLVSLVDNLSLHTVQGRLADLLLREAEAAQRGEPVAPLTQAEMAARLGTVREMVGRALKGFEAQGLIRMERGAISILDRAGLQQQAES